MLTKIIIITLQNILNKSKCIIIVVAAALKERKKKKYKQGNIFFYKREKKIWKETQWRCSSSLMEICDWDTKWDGWKNIRGKYRKRKNKKKFNKSVVKKNREESSKKRGKMKRRTKKYLLTFCQTFYILFKKIILTGAKMFS